MTEQHEVHEPFFDPFTVDELHTLIDRARREARVASAEDYKRGLRDFAHAAVILEAFIVLSRQRANVAEMMRLEAANAALDELRATEEPRAEL